jgi:hypothetical protein
MRLLQRIFGILALVAVLLVVPRTAEAEKRVALVIGNSAYQHAPALLDPVKDAQAMAAMFQRAGFDVVTAQYDVGALDFRRALRQFEDAAAVADIAVVYYSGHGIEIQGVSYLLPVDAKLTSDRDVGDETISLDRLTAAVDGAKRLRLVIIDACRDNPFARTMLRQRTASTPRGNPGLGAVEPSSINTLIAYAAKAGSVVEDGNGEHSPFTAALLNNLFVPGLDVRLAFGRIRDQVLKATGNRQEPFVYGSLGSGSIALVVRPGPLVAETDTAAEKSDYNLVATIGTKGAWEVFLSQHPNGFYSDLARRQIAKLNAGEPAANVDKGMSPPPIVASLDAPKPASSPGPSTEEQRAWDRIKDSSSASDFRDFIKKYPTSVLANKAQDHIDAIERAAREQAAKEQAAREATAEAQRQSDAKRKADEAARQKAEQDAALAKAQAEAKAAGQVRQQAEREAAPKRAEEARQKQLANAAALAKAQAETKAAEQARQQAERDAALKREQEARQTALAEAPKAKPASADKAHSALPDFPWPPPAASASYVLPQRLFGSRTTVGEATDAIIAALERNGYVERSFYGTPAPGVALITRLERINDDGSPAAAERWAAGGYQNDALNLAQFLRGLFYADPGRYRVIVFIIQDQPFTQAPEKAFSGEQAEALLPSGANVLPPEVAERPVAESHCTALIYEFANDGTAMRKVQSRLTGMQHLEKAGLLAALEKPN